MENEGLKESELLSRDEVLTINSNIKLTSLVSVLIIELPVRRLAVNGVHVRRILGIGKRISDQVSFSNLSLSVRTESTFELAILLDKIHIILLEVHGNQKLRL